MKRTKFAVYVYGANGSTVEFRGYLKDDSQALVALDLLARLASISENKPAQMYLEQLVLDKEDLEKTRHDAIATYKAGSVDRTDSESI